MRHFRRLSTAAACAAALIGARASPARADQVTREAFEKLSASIDERPISLLVVVVGAGSATVGETETGGKGGVIVAEPRQQQLPQLAIERGKSARTVVVNIDPAGFAADREHHAQRAQDAGATQLELLWLQATPWTFEADDARFTRWVFIEKHRQNPSVLKLLETFHIDVGGEPDDYQEAVEEARHDRMGWPVLSQYFGKEVLLDADVEAFNALVEKVRSGGGQVVLANAAYNNVTYPLMHMPRDLAYIALHYTLTPQFCPAGKPGKDTTLVALEAVNTYMARLFRCDAAQGKVPAARPIDEITWADLFPGAG